MQTLKSTARRFCWRLEEVFLLMYLAARCSLPPGRLFEPCSPIIPSGFPVTDSKPLFELTLGSMTFFVCLFFKGRVLLHSSGWLLTCSLAVSSFWVVGLQAVATTYSWYYLKIRYSTWLTTLNTGALIISSSCWRYYTLKYCKTFECCRFWAFRENSTVKLSWLFLTGIFFSFGRIGLHICSHWPRSHYIAHADFELMAGFLPQPSKCWDYRNKLPHPGSGEVLNHIFGFLHIYYIM